MNKRVLLLNINDVINGSLIEDNIDIKVLAKTIGIAQESGLKPILGAELYNSLIEAVYNKQTYANTLSVLYVNLIEAAKPYLIAKTVSDFIVINSYKISNKGLIKLNDNSASVVSNSDMQGVKDYYDNLIAGYKADLIKFLKDSNLIDYNNDVQITSESTGWFLGDTFRTFDNDTTVSLDASRIDIYVTGATFNAETGVTTFTNNLGGTFSVAANGGTSNVSSITGFTYSPSANTLTIVDSTGGTLTTAINSFSGLSVDNAVSASTFYGDGSNLTGIHDYYTTGATLSNNTIYFDRNNQLSAYSVSLSAFSTQDVYVTGATFDSNSGVASFHNNTGGTFTVNGFQPRINGTGFVKASGTTISYDNTSYLATSIADAKYLPFSGGTLTGDLLLYSSTPSNALSAVPKNYVDNLLNGLSWKYSVRASTTTALPAYTVSSGNTILTANANGALTLDTITPIVNDRVLVKNESTTDRVNNGIYTVTQIGDGSNPYILTRATDANTSARLEAATVYVRQGSTEVNRVYAVNVSPVVLGATQITFSLISGAGTYINGTGLDLNANVFSINSSVVTLTGSQTLTNKSIAVSQLTGNGALTKTDDANVTLTLGGSPSTALINSTSLTLGWNGQLSASRGGSGVNNAGSFTWGSNNITFNTTATTNLTLPVSGTVATTTTVSPFVAQTDGATITINCNNQATTNATVTLGGNRTLAFSNFVDGAYATLVVTQDATGSRTLALPAGTKVVGNSAGAVVLSTSTGATDVLSFFKNGSSVFCSYGQNFN